MLDILRNSEAKITGNLGFANGRLEPKKIVSINEVVGSTYLRLNVSDQPGVMARISTILSEYEIGIESLIQKNNRDDYADIVVITNAVVEESLNLAVKN